VNAALTATDERRLIVQTGDLPEQGGAQPTNARVQPRKVVPGAGRAVRLTDVVPLGKTNEQYFPHSFVSVPAGDMSTEARYPATTR
jgi:hypothetical protein